MYLAELKTEISQNQQSTNYNEVREQFNDIFQIHFKENLLCINGYGDNLGVSILTIFTYSLKFQNFKEYEGHVVQNEQKNQS